MTHVFFRFFLQTNPQNWINVNVVEDEYCSKGWRGLVRAVDLVNPASRPKEKAHYHGLGTYARLDVRWRHCLSRLIGRSHGGHGLQRPGQQQCRGEECLVAD